MTDAEIVRAAGEMGMGWTWNPAPILGGFFGADGFYGPFEWDPLVRISDTMMLLAAIGKKGYVFESKATSVGFTVEFRKVGEHSKSSPVYSTFERAITIAVIRAMEAPHA